MKDKNGNTIKDMYGNEIKEGDVVLTLIVLNEELYIYPFNISIAVTVGDSINLESVYGLCPLESYWDRPNHICALQKNSNLREICKDFFREQKLYFLEEKEILDKYMKKQ